MKKLILIGVLLFFVACLNTKKEVKKEIIIGESYAPQNPIVVYAHKDELLLKGAVKKIDNDERYDKNGNLTYYFGETLVHTKDSIIQKLGSVTTIYLKDAEGRIYKALLDDSGELFTNFNYNEKGLLAKEYGIENGVEYSTSYKYDEKGRVTQSSYNYGNDKTVNVYFTNKDLGEGKLQITNFYDDQDQTEIYEYTDGYMTASTLDGKKTTYTYTWDKQGNWISQSLSDGGITTKRKITYHK